MHHKKLQRLTEISVWQLDDDPVSCDCRGIAGYVPIVREAVASGDVELPAVPRTNNHAAFDGTIRERTTDVRAQIRQCVELSLDIENDELAPSVLDGFRCSRSDFASTN